VQEDRLWKVLGRVADLNEEMKQNKASDYFRNNERVERLFDIIRSMIINFKISRKSMKGSLV
jgi:guanylate kinase